MKTVVTRQCPKCKKQSAEYIYNEAGNLVFHECVLCGYDKKDYAKDLRK